MPIDLLTWVGWGCVAWTLFEFTGLVVRARWVSRFRRPGPAGFHARDLRGEAIDVDIVS